MGGVAVVTDSTASLGADAARRGVRVVDLQVVVNGVSHPESDPEVSGRRVAQALRSGAVVSTSRPAPEAFASLYEELAAGGATAVVSVHLSSRVSGTCDAALLAAASAPVPVTVVDSRTIALATGFAALSGAAAAEAGATAEEVAATVRERAETATTYFYVDTLEYLRRGGRIGAAQALLGSALAVKPLLSITDGAIAPYERVRTRTKALSRLVELAAAAVPAEGVVDVAVHHLDDPGGADRLLAELLDLLARRRSAVTVREARVAEVSAVLGVHVGPGTLGVVVAPTRSD